MVSFTQELIDFHITPQPNEVTCGQACLHSLYRHDGLDLTLTDVLRDVHPLAGGGTLAVSLALDAIGRGYQAAIYTCNLQLFDPSWFQPGAPPLDERLKLQAKRKRSKKLRAATRLYIEYLAHGGRVEMCDINEALLHQLLDDGKPLIAGLSATWLYQCARERQKDMKPDDIIGEPTGHFVILRGLDRRTHRVSVADPYLHRPVPASHYYQVPVDRLVAAIMLGIVTFDAKLLVIEKP